MSLMTVTLMSDMNDIICKERRVSGYAQVVGNDMLTLAPKAFITSPIQYQLALNGASY